MSFKTDQYHIQADFFPGQCGGKFGRGYHEFILDNQYRHLNLYPPIYDQAIAYFGSNKIQWWHSNDGLPTNHTVSSQIACVNHLCWAQRCNEAATALLQALDPDYTALPFDTGRYIEFEYNGCEVNNGRNLLGEKGTTRGSNTTSLDACMLAQKADIRLIICIEWKYVETYGQKAENAARIANYNTRKAIYKRHLVDPDSPIIVDPGDFDRAYLKFAVEPYYQLMRQTLWAQLFARNHLLGVTDYLHIHVIPDENRALLACKSSPEISTDNMCAGWQACLRHPGKYQHISPRQFVEPGVRAYNPGLHHYLERRYWRNTA